MHARLAAVAGVDAAEPGPAAHKNAASPPHLGPHGVVPVAVAKLLSDRATDIWAYIRALTVSIVFSHAFSIAITDLEPEYNSEHRRAYGVRPFALGLRRRERRNEGDV